MTSMQAMTLQEVVDALARQRRQCEDGVHAEAGAYHLLADATPCSGREPVYPWLWEICLHEHPRRECTGWRVRRAGTVHLEVILAACYSRATTAAWGTVTIAVRSIPFEHATPARFVEAALRALYTAN